MKYVLLYRQNENERIEKNLKKYNDGIEQLNKAKKKIDDTTRKITQQREKIKEKQDEIEQKKTELKNHQADLEAKEKEQSDEKIKQQSLKTLWESKKNELELQMKEIEPHLKNVEQELRKISDSDIAEMFKYGSQESINQDIKEVVNATKIILGLKDWKFMPEAFKKIKKESIKEPPSQQELRKLDKIVKKPNFNPNYMKQKSQAVGNFTSWILKLEYYGAQSQVFGPKIEKEKEQKRKLEESTKKVEDLERQLDELKSKFDTLNNTIKDMEESKLDLEAELDKLETDANNFSNMLYKLKDEKVKWTEIRDGLDEEKQYVDGNSILAATTMIYLGVCFEEDRNNLNTIFQNKLGTTGFKFSKNYSITKLFNCENEIFTWNENGLPNDDVSIENAIITLNSHRTCYIIDPQYQAKDWLINQLNIKQE